MVVRLFEFLDNVKMTYLTYFLYLLSDMISKMKSSKNKSVVYIDCTFNIHFINIAKRPENVFMSLEIIDICQNDIHHILA